MSTRVITQEEYEVVNNVVTGFMRKMKGNPRWEEDDVRQELLIYWCQKKQNGWTKPEEWKGAMGRCLSMHLINIQQKECTQKRHAECSMLSLDQLIEEGREFPDHKPTPIPTDLLDLLKQPDREICELLIQGYTKTEIGSRLKLSRVCIHRRIMNVRKQVSMFFKI